MPHFKLDEAVGSLCGIAMLVVGGVALAAPGASEPSAQPISDEAQQAAALLKAPDAYTRQMGFMRLEALREPATAPVIHQYVESHDPDTRAFSLRALAAVERSEAIPLLIERLKQDRDPRVRVAALLALEPIEDATAMQAMLGSLRDRNTQVRMAAADIVSRMETAQAREAIITRWHREHHRDVRRVLEQAMKRIGML